MRALAKLSLVIALALAPACGDGQVGDDDDDNGNGDGGAGNGDGGQDCQELCPDAGQISCKLVDLVISVDPSGSMTEELDAIRDEVFPGFAQRLPSISQGIDNFRVGTIDSCPTPANFHIRGNGGNCNFSSGEVWIDSSSPNMDTEFACVGDLYLGDVECSGDNDDEQPASAAATALEPPWSTDENANFSREDALLVVVAITDEDEQPVPNMNANEVYNRLIDTKGGDPRRMVFLGIGGGSNCTGVYGTADEAVKLKQITDLFIAQDRGVWWDLCAGNLEDGLDEAFQVIERACDELPPIL